MCCPIKEENCWVEIRVGKKVEGMKKKSRGILSMKDKVTI